MINTMYCNDLKYHDRNMSLKDNFLEQNYAV